MKSAIVIVNWNSGRRLLSCLQSLPSTAQIVVIDNASADDSLQVAKASGTPAVFIENSSNRGLAAAVNQGFAATSTPYVLLLNPDVRATPDSIALLETVLDHNPRAGAVGGYVNEKYLPRELATPWTVVRENLGIPVGTLNAAEVGQAAAAALLVRREAYIAAQGFDEVFYPAWYEDVDFCRSLHDHGWEVRFARDAEFVHEGGYSAKAMGSAEFAAAYYRNQLRYISKYFGWPARLMVRFSIVAGMAARTVVQPSRASASSKVIIGALGGW
ncbi:MAG TPA: glycosyltransferase family 2 protein [Terriglobia bacterium]|nr:glycosyltransferase family 2 protein [Terriglobia bacterium]